MENNHPNPIVFYCLHISKALTILTIPYFCWYTISRLLHINDTQVTGQVFTNLACKSLMHAKYPIYISSLMQQSSGDLATLPLVDLKYKARCAGPNLCWMECLLECSFTPSIDVLLILWRELTETQKILNYCIQITKC